MKIYKFGGASVKDATSIKNVIQVLQKVGFNDTFIVVSAIGKTTNALEVIVNKYINNEDYQKSLDEIQQKHQQLIDELFTQTKDISARIQYIFDEVQLFLSHNKSTQYNFVYDQIVPVGEYLSTQILSGYLKEQNIENQWVDAATLIKTDTTYRDGQVLWEETEKNIQQLTPQSVYLTQGFIGSDANGFTTTLGREGSDYTASILAYCLNASSVTIWKDVDGVLNADPRYFDTTVLLEKISYKEAIELAYYGASVIHPKTLQPLQNKEIPLMVKSFIHPENSGTTITKGQPLVPQTACYIVKKNQFLVGVSSRNFSFIVERNISEIIEKAAHFGLKINMIQNSAISFLLCIDDIFGTIQNFIDALQEKFDVSLQSNLSLYTIRHYQQEEINQWMKEKNVVLVQKLPETAQLVVKE